jgi:hypothetical protein
MAEPQCRHLLEPKQLRCLDPPVAGKNLVLRID